MVRCSAIKRFSACLVAVLALGGAASAQDRTWTVAIGDKVPTPIRASVVRGGIPGFREPGVTYLLVFVNFEQILSRQAIAQLDTLQTEHGKKLQILAISEQGPDDTRAFVESPEWSGRIPFAVAADPTRAAFQTFFGPHGVPTLPLAYVMRDGVVQWAGVPASLAEPVAGVIRGSWDLAAARRAAEQRELWNKMMHHVDDLAAAKKMDEALETLNEACKSAMGDQTSQCMGAKFSLLVRMGRIPDAIAVGEQLLASPGNPRQWAGLAWTLIAMAPTDASARAFALKAALAADKSLRGRDPMVGGILARVQFANGQVSQAAATARKALEQSSDMPDLAKSLNEDLRKYEAYGAPSAPRPSGATPSKPSAAPPAGSPPVR